MIIIDENNVIFDLMREISEEYIQEFNSNWRNMNRNFFILFLKKWQDLPKKPTKVTLPRDNINEIIVKDFYGRDIFSILIDERKVYGLIEQYQGFWNAIYVISNKKLLLFTL